MNVFNLRQALVDAYSSFITSFFRTTDASVRQYGEPQLTERLLGRHLLIQLTLSFEAGREYRPALRSGRFGLGYCARQMAGSKSGALKPEIIANG